MGQVCTATSRIYVQDKIYDRFLEQFKEYTIQNSKSGDPFDEKTPHGPQVSRAQQEKILRYVETAKAEGGRLLLGESQSQPAPGKGHFVEPTIVADAMQWRED